MGYFAIGTLDQRVLAGAEAEAEADSTEADSAEAEAESEAEAEARLFMDVVLKLFASSRRAFIFFSDTSGSGSATLGAADSAEAESAALELSGSAKVTLEPGPELESAATLEEEEGGGAAEGAGQESGLSRLKSVGADMAFNERSFGSWGLWT